MPPAWPQPQKYGISQRSMVSTGRAWPQEEQHGLNQKTAHWSGYLDTHALEDTYTYFAAPCASLRLICSKRIQAGTIDSSLYFGGLGMSGLWRLALLWHGSRQLFLGDPGMNPYVATTKA